MRLSVVIPSKGLDPLLRQCLSALWAAGRNAPGVELDVVVIDNASDIPYDGRVIPDGVECRIVRVDVPLSFSAACNLGAARADRPDHILFLNNDVLCHELVLTDTLAVMETAGAAIVGTRLVYIDGRIQHTGILFDDGVRGPYHAHHGMRSDLVPRAPRAFQAVTGAYLLIDAAVFRDLGGFDEVYPFAYEDVDLCLRAGQMGHFVACAQGTDSIHLQGSSRTPESYDRDREARRIFHARWSGRYTIDGWRNEP